MPNPRCAIVLAAHGDRGGDRPNSWLFAHAENVRRLVGRACVAPGVLKGEPALEAAFAHIADTGVARAIVYPLFMSDGYFMSVLRRRVTALNLVPAPTFLAPLGSHPGLPALMLERASAAAGDARMPPASARLIVIGHGSRLGSANADATRRMIGRLEHARRFTCVEPAFLEEEPYLMDVLTRDPRPAVVTGFLGGEGMHAAGDVPQIIAASGAHAVYAGAIGTETAIADLIAAAIEALPPTSG